MTRLPLIVLLTATASGSASELIYNSSRNHPSNGGVIYTLTDTEPPEPSSTGELAGGFETEGRVGHVVTFGGTARLVDAINLVATGFGPAP